MEKRNEYGALIGEATATGKALIALAKKTGKLEAEYVDVDKKHRGSALNYDIYDIKGSSVLIQRRYTVCDKYGNHPTKSYWLVRKIGTGVRVESMDQHKAKIVKLAKTVDDLGDLIDCLQGKKSITIKTKSTAVAPHIAYKQVAMVDGRMLSIYDGSTEYEIGKELVPKAQDDHQGGFYVYLTEEAARGAQFPDNSALVAAPRKVLQVQVSGKRVEYSNGKRAYSKLVPLNIV